MPFELNSSNTLSLKNVCVCVCVLHLKRNILLETESRFVVVSIETSYHEWLFWSFFGLFYKSACKDGKNIHVSFKIFKCTKKAVQTILQTKMNGSSIYSSSLTHRDGFDAQTWVTTRSCKLWTWISITQKG